LSACDDLYPVAANIEHVISLPAKVSPLFAEMQMKTIMTSWRSLSFCQIQSARRLGGT
jgi:hypothetical protein